MQLSILIPANTEIFLKNTVEDILKNKEAETEIIIGCDGNWPDPSIEDHPDVSIVYTSTPIGQRAITNLCAKLAKGKWLMKVDAHCAFDKGFDKKLIDGFKETGDNVTVVPVMRNLWAFDWKCYDCGWKKYQDALPPKCEQCGGIDLRRKIMWIGKERPQSSAYCFDSEPHFQYHSEYRKRPEYIEAQKSGFTETMSLQGSCFVLTKEKYFELNVCNEEYGNWGNQGIEVACKTWLSGGRVLTNHNTWYAHLFRTHSGFSFPWKNSESKVSETKKKVWDDIVNFKLNNQIYPVSWLIEKFLPVPGWDEESLKKLKEA